MNLQFGSGVLYGSPNGGNEATNPTPYRFGVLQDVSVEFKGDSKKLYGQSQSPISVARGKVDVSCKAKLALLDPNMLNQLFFGQASATGITQVSDQELNVVAVGDTVAVANKATFVADCGVQYAATSAQLQKVAAAPAVGQYTCDNAGNYGFNVADLGTSVLVSYTYTIAARGTTISLANEPMGFAPLFEALLYNNFRGKLFAVQLNSCIATTLSIPTKNEDFWVVDIAFEAMADASNNLGKIFADVS